MKYKCTSRIFIIFLFSFVLLFYSGCFINSINKKSADKESADVKSVKNPAVTIHFSWWGNQDRTDYTLKGIEIFESQNPYINVVPEYAIWNGYESAFEKSFSEGTNADVMQINFDWLYKYSPDGMGFYDFNKLYDYIDFYNFTLNDLEYGKVNGKLNAIPIAFNSIIPIYNKSVFDKYNLKIPSSWDDLFAAAKVLSPKGQYVLGSSTKHFFLLVLAWFEQNFSKKIFIDNVTLNVSEVELENMISFAARLISENVVHPDVYHYEAKDIYDGHLAGTLGWCNGSFNIASAIEEIGGKPVLGNFIIQPDAKESGWYLKPVSMYAIKKDCKHPKEAAELVNFLLNNQDFALLQKNEKGVPVSNTSLTALMERGALESLQYSSLMKIRFYRGNINQMLSIMENSTVNNSLADNVFAYLSGKKTKAEAAKDFSKAIKKAME